MKRKKEVNWLHLLVLVTIVLLTTFSIIEADMLAVRFAQDNSGKITFEIVEQPKAITENVFVQKEGT